jgi:hypothetical protein
MGIISFESFFFDVPLVTATVIDGWCSFPSMTTTSYSSLVKLRHVSELETEKDNAGMHFHNGSCFAASLARHLGGERGRWTAAP